MATKTIYQNEYLRLIGKLRDRREGLGISQTQLAAHLGWPQQRISSIESGSRRLDVLEFCLLASALGVPPAEVSDLISKAVKAVRVTRIK
ncbi:helix-turn-helix transcriptional regulator [Stenotrophomonas maltophilia]|nr:helix-turn-helix transcriptional regulator [Stenotrophomonas maltophilia]MBN4961078.1 helix-turn-helix transcriptional regulator [Stenotrophomonas maltophilia]